MPTPSKRPATLSAEEFDNELRGVSDFYALYRLCGRMRCRHSRRCRGFPRECVPRFRALVPEDARAFLLVLCMARSEGLPFEKAMHRCKEEFAAFKQWHAAIRGADGRKAPSLRLRSRPSAS